MPFPYTTEKAHVTGPVTNTSGNAASETGGAAILSTEGRQEFDVSDKIYLLNPTINPFSTFLTSYGKELDGETYKGAGLRVRQVHSPKFDCLTDQMPGRYASVSGTYSTGAVTITVAGAGTTPARIFTVGDTVKNIRTGEILKIATVASDSTVTIASTGRGYGTTAAAAGVDGDQLVIIGNSNEENSALRNANTTEVGDEYNYTQIFRKSTAVSRTKSDTRLLGNKDERTRQREIAGVQMVTDVELSFLFGERKKTTGPVQGKVERLTGGVEEHINGSGAPIHDQGSNPLTAPDFDSALSESFVNGSREKLLLSGPRIGVALSEIARNQLVTKMDDTTYGLSIGTWNHPLGFVVKLANHPYFNVKTGKDGYGMILDVLNDNASYAYAEFMAPKLTLNVQAPGTDGYVDDVTAEVGLDRRNAEQNSIIKNVA